MAPHSVDSGADSFHSEDSVSLRARRVRPIRLRRHPQISTLDAADDDALDEVALSEEENK